MSSSRDVDNGLSSFETLQVDLLGPLIRHQAPVFPYLTQHMPLYIQVLRLLGPYGASLSQEMGQWLKKYEASLGSSLGSSSGGNSSINSKSHLPTSLPEHRRRRSNDDIDNTSSSNLASRQLISAFLDAKLQNVVMHGRWDPDPSYVSQLICAELIGLDLDSLGRKGGESASISSKKGIAPSSPCIIKAADGCSGRNWLLELASCTACGQDMLVIKRLASLMKVSVGGAKDRHQQQQQEATQWVNWDVIFRWLSSSRFHGGMRKNEAHAASIRLTRLVCFSELSRTSEALDLLLPLQLESCSLTKKENDTAAAAVALSILMDYGHRYYHHDGPSWGLALSKIRALAQMHEEPDDDDDVPSTAIKTDAASIHDLHERVLGLLSHELPASDLLHVLPNDGDLQSFLRALENCLYMSGGQ